ncbi:gene transfer agent family protein [Falsirhodobacter xinxiangensis]|uniref:gene transfer agent family protein n=1 Tax=Falsirhodobacter xinxiangensis TaxID=2530049 RepID=UPI0010AB4EEC|nr:gene transfer agent family protein [Rhodobacter xinxiangensis]
MNPFAGEVTVVLDGVPHVAKLTLGALAELETVLEAGSLIDLVQRFEGGRFTTRDVLAVVVAGLRGGGWTGTAADLLHADVGGGATGAARAAADLLHRAFAMP